MEKKFETRIRDKIRYFNIGRKQLVSNAVESLMTYVQREKTLFYLKYPIFVGQFLRNQKT
ncbi:hypothetical protein EO244_15135 [Ancylomarina salipaludis]|uniref:Uncharacterized protein n=1 Tax=Ancylomarina salipaludis TaxID=2501299 RepID=A0A4Q1JJ99_9BACT|nr:hypothetical protein EO244_15135 [Ancylomarina salipaludis]